MCVVIFLSVLMMMNFKPISLTSRWRRVDDHTRPDYFHSQAEDYTRLDGKIQPRFFVINPRIAHDQIMSDYSAAQFSHLFFHTCRPSEINSS